MKVHVTTLTLQEESHHVSKLLI